jgi:hypothetical protein
MSAALYFILLQTEMICADCAIIIADGLQYLFIYFIYDVYIV